MVEEALRRRPHEFLPIFPIGEALGHRGHQKVLQLLDEILGRNDKKKGVKAVPYRWGANEPLGE